MAKKLLILLVLVVFSIGLGTALANNRDTFSFSNTLQFGHYPHSFGEWRFAIRSAEGVVVLHSDQFPSLLQMDLFPLLARMVACSGATLDTRDVVVLFYFDYPSFDRSLSPLPPALLYLTTATCRA